MHGSYIIHLGDALAVLRTMPECSVQCVVTSPPYWGLRRYIEDGAPEKQYEMGLEASPDAYVERMVEVFREVRRVLRDDGTAWVNLGDSYTSGGRETFGTFQPDTKQATHPAIKSAKRAPQPDGLKPKDLIGIPWRVALALQADGWYLRSDIIWHKPNPMPESVTDRPTKSHESLFLLSKSERYYYDAEAVREPAEYGRREWGDGRIDYDGGTAGVRRQVTTKGADPSAGRNRRTVWTIPTEAFPGAHFATFPRKLVEPCILAGTSERGCCPDCGKAWRRVVERTNEIAVSAKGSRFDVGKTGHNGNGRVQGGERFVVRSTGWRPACDHYTNDHDTPVFPCVVLDPFAGSGTTLMVACLLGRNAMGIELKPEYRAMALDRIVAALAPSTHRTDAGEPSGLFTGDTR